MVRAPCCEKVGLKRGRWTAEEDEKLRKYIQENGEGSWRSLPKNAGLLRCGKSCRLRWINYLRTDLKRGSISAQEEEIIINLHASMGNRWSLIAAHLPGRTDNEIKNYWNSHLSRKIDSFRRRNPNFIPPPPPPPKLSGGRKKKIKNSNRRVGGPKKTAAGEENAVVFMPTTPTPERESSVGRVVTKSSQPEETTTEERERESGSSMLDLDDMNIMEDLSGLWGPEVEISRAKDFGPGNLYGEMDSGLKKWESVSSETHDDMFSWIWDDNDDKWNSGDREREMEMDGAMLSWLFS